LFFCCFGRCRVGCIAVEGLVVIFGVSVAGVAGVCSCQCCVLAMSASVPLVALSKRRKHILTSKSAINRRQQQGARSSAFSVRIGNSTMNDDVTHHNEIKKSTINRR